MEFLKEYMKWGKDCSTLTSTKFECQMKRSLKLTLLHSEPYQGIFSNYCFGTGAVAQVLEHTVALKI